MSAVIPQANSVKNIFYAASLLRSAPASCTPGSPCLDAFLNQNQKIIQVATVEPTTNKAKAMADARGTGVTGMGAKQYLPYYKDQTGWRLHFGEKWGRFEQLKSRFDPLNILAPGQRIFQRKHLEG